MRYAHCMGVFTKRLPNWPIRGLVARLISGGFGFMRDSIAWVTLVYVQ